MDSTSKHVDEDILIPWIPLNLNKEKNSEGTYHAQYIPEYEQEESPFNTATIRIKVLGGWVCAGRVDNSTKGGTVKVRKQEKKNDTY